MSAEYMFTYMQRGNIEVPIVRIKSTIESETKLDIGKHTSVVVEQSDINIFHDFVVKNPIKQEQVGEDYYRWYQLEYYSKYVDKSPTLQTLLDKSNANLDYISMMSGIDIPTEDPEPESNFEEE